MKHANIVVFLAACNLIGSLQAATKSAKPPEFPPAGEAKIASTTAKTANTEKSNVQRGKNNPVQSEKKRQDKKQPVIDMGCVSTE